MKPNDTSDTIHTKRHTSANDTHIAWNQFWILPRGIVCPCPFVRAPSPCKEMNCIPPARAPPHILAPSHPEPVAECRRRIAPASTRTHTHIHKGNESMPDLCNSKGMSRHSVIRPSPRAIYISKSQWTTYQIRRGPAVAFTTIPDWLQLLRVFAR